MPKITLLVRVDQPIHRFVRGMVRSLDAQTFQDWEIVFLVPEEAPAEWYADSSFSHEKTSILFYRDRLLIGSLNPALSSLGEWVGFMGQHDQLEPDALETLMATVDGSPSLIYTNCVCFSRWGAESYRQEIPNINPVRLWHHNYLSGLSLFPRDWILSSGGFRTTATDDPEHDLLIRLTSQGGLVQAVHVPQVVYRKYRNSLFPIRDPRKLEFVPSYDLEAIEASLRNTWPKVYAQQIHAIPRIDFLDVEAPRGELVVILQGDEAQDLRALELLPEPNTETGMVFRVLHTGDSPAAARRVCDFRRIPFETLEGRAESQALNQIGFHSEGAVLALLKGLAPDETWMRGLHRIMRGFGAKAAGARGFLGDRIVFNVPNHKYEGRYYDYRGRFGELTVPQNVAGLSGDCLLLDVMAFRELGGFDESFSTYYALDLTMRMHAKGYGVIWTPEVLYGAFTNETLSPEISRLAAKHPDWVDPFGLFQV